MGSADAGKVVAITGCTRGIGRALFEWFAHRGYSVAGCGTAAPELAAVCAAFPGALVSAVDVCSEEAVARWTEAVVARFGPIDVLLCNAGTNHSPARFCEISEEEWQRVFEVNVLATARVLRHFVARVRAPGATVVLMGSRYGRSAACGQGCYSASKWPIEAMAKTLALELQDQGISVVSFDPGVVNTEMLRLAATAPEDLAWCQQQRSPADFAAEAGPFILSLTLADTGRSLTCPGSPASYFQTGLAYKDRAAWANGIGPFVRASEDDPDASCSAAPRAAASVVATGAPQPRRYFISGVMLGSSRPLSDGAAELVPQDYRARIAAAIRSADATADVIDPLDVARARAAECGQTLEAADDGLVREVFGNVVGLASQCDVVISNLPEASMGSAVECWEAKKAGRTVLTISPLAANWLLRSVTDHNFSDLDDFEASLHLHLPRPERKAAA